MIDILRRYHWQATDFAGKFELIEVATSWEWRCGNCPEVATGAQKKFPAVASIQPTEN